MTSVRFTWSAQHSCGLLRRPKFTQLPNTQCLEHRLSVGPFTSTMKRCRWPRREEGVHTPLDRQFGIAEQGLHRIKHGVRFGDSVPHAGLRAPTIVQPRAQCLHAFHHTPDPTSSTVADYLKNITRFALCEWSSNNGEAFLFPLHAQSFTGVRHVFQNTSQVIHCTSHCVQIARPAQVIQHPTLVFHGLHQMSHDASFGLYGGP